MNKKILIIEDETALLYALSAALNVEGLETLTATNGKEGLTLARSSKPNLIVLDLRLPEVDGFQVLEDLKKNEETKQIPVVIVTNLGEKDTEDRCKKLGAIDFITKADNSLEEIVNNIKKRA